MTRDELRQNAAARLQLWKAEPDIMVEEEFGVTPDPWQREALRAFPHHNRIALKACKGPGKTSVLAWFMLNFLATRPNCRIGATSITGDNLSSNLWPELAKWMAISRFFSARFVWTKTQVFNVQHPATWWAQARTWPKKASAEQQADALAGLHEDYAMFVGDESGGYPQSIMATAEAVLASGIETKVVQAGNPTHLEGPLYRACAQDRHLWKVITITGDPDDPKRSSRISIDWARQQIASYGRENPWVKVNVLGEFPDTSINALLGVEEVEKAMHRHYRIDAFDWSQKRLGIDVARFGDDRCFDDQTEILTDDGWKLFADLRGDERVLSLDGDVAVWGPIDHIHQAPWDGYLNVYERRHVNFAVTDNHRMLVRSNPKSHRHIFKAYRDCPQDFVIRGANTWAGTSEPVRRFSSVKPMPRGGVFRRDYAFALEDWAEFVGWFVAEGNVYAERRAGGRLRVMITQYPGAKRSRLEALLTRMELTWRPCSNKTQIEFTNAAIGNWLRSECGRGAAKKCVPREIKDGSPEAIRWFLDGFLAGDGTVRADGNGRTYVTTSKRLADDLQEMLAKIGRAGLLRVKNQAHTTFRIAGREVHRRHQSYVLYERGFESGKYVRKRQVKRERYVGTVWCVATPLESIYVRRQGVTMWSGNTVIFPRQGCASWKPVILRNKRTTDIAARAAKAIGHWGAELTFVDDTGHWGHGVIDNLITAGIGAVPVIFSDPAINPRYKNRRAEMWLEMAEWVKRGGALPNVVELTGELVTPTYSFVGGKFVLEEKDQIKERLGRSPDLADALALTFAIPDMPNEVLNRMRQGGKVAHDFDPFNLPTYDED